MTLMVGLSRKGGERYVYIRSLITYDSFRYAGRVHHETLIANL